MTQLPLEKSLYSLHFNILKCMGAWVVDPSNRLILNAYMVYKTIMTVMAFAGCVSLFMDLYMVFGDFKKTTWNLCITTLFAGGLLKNIYTIHRSNVINRLRIRLHQDASSRDTPDDHNLTRLSLKELKYVQILFYGVASISVPAWLTIRYMSYLWGPRDIPVPLLLPIKFNFDDDFQYNYVFFLVGLVGVAGITLVLETELAMFSILIQISREYKRLLNDITKINELYEDCTACGFENRNIKNRQEVNPWLREVRTKSFVKECSKRQQKLIEYTKDFELCYSVMLLLQMFVVTLLVVVSTIQCMLEYEHFSLNLSYQMGYISTLVVDMFLVCGFATRIRGQCCQVGEEAYSILWYYMGADIQRDICMIIMRSQHPPKITFGKIMETNLHVFMLMMRNIYSWLALFQQLEFKANE